MSSSIPVTLDIVFSSKIEKNQSTQEEILVYIADALFRYCTENEGLAPEASDAKTSMIYLKSPLAEYEIVL